MKGTKKQVKWAEVIKKETLSMLETISENIIDSAYKVIDEINRSENFKEKQKEKVKTYCEKAFSAIQEIQNNDDASFFIDNFKIVTYDKVGKVKKATEILLKLFQLADISEKESTAQILIEAIESMSFDDKELQGKDYYIKQANTFKENFKTAIEIAKTIIEQDNLSESMLKNLLISAKYISNYIDRQDDAETIVAFFSNYLGSLENETRKKQELQEQENEYKREGFVESLILRMIFALEEFYRDNHRAYRIIELRKSLY